MTLEAFALATSATIGMEGGQPLMRRVEMAARVSDALYVRGNADIRRMIPGAGLCRYGSRLFPTVLADRSIIGADTDEDLRVDELPKLREALAYILGRWSSDLADELRVLLVTQEALHAAPGTALVCGTSGRMGPHVTWGSSQQGFLTAGHVAPSVGAFVTDTGGAQLGTVVWSNDPALAPSVTPDLDAALVEFSSTHTASTGKSAVVAGAGQVLSVASTTKQANVLGFFDQILLGTAPACYAQCYATDTKMTQPGDSGGLVEAGGDVVGIVIGGFVRRDMTLVQAVDYQLKAIRRRSGHMVSL